MDGGATSLTSAVAPAPLGDHLPQVGRGPSNRPMMRQYELVERVSSYNAHVDEALLNRAYVYAMQKHGNQTRASGDPYFSHPLEVAAILTGLKLDDATIATALLHDTIEDTDATRAEIDNLFGAEIGTLVDGLTKISRLDLVTREESQAENLRKLLLAVAEDVRVLLVKLADRLHNMRTLHWVPPEKRARIAEETLEVYAPLARKMGIQWMVDELEDLAFHVLHPDDAAMITKRVSERRASYGDVLKHIEFDLAQRLAEHGVRAEVKGREKTPYSIFSKMKRKAISFEQMSDVYGFRVIVNTVGECYQALGVVHTIWKAVPGRFKDLISTPKQNDYQSLHTTVVGPRDQRVELQIRTHEMHRIAEYGIAAHALYKEGEAPRDRLLKDSGAYSWLRQTIEHLSDGGSSQEFLENTKLELFQDRVFCFTPKGKLIALPPGATPIDFAYAVHTDVGNTCTGCKVNGHRRPLVTPLSSGDEVEILCTKGKSPPAAWKALAVTGKARAAIRRANRDAERRQFTRLGHHMIGSDLARRATDETADLNKAARLLGHADADALAYAIGRGTESVAAVMTALGAGEGPADGEADHKPVPIRGIGGDLPVRFSTDHRAIPGDAIVGILQPGTGVTVYPASASEALSAYTHEPHVWVDLSWDGEQLNGSVFPATVRVVMINETGALAAVATVIAREGGNIDDVEMKQKTSGYREVTFAVEVKNRAHLARILEAVRQLSHVSEAHRIDG